MLQKTTQLSLWNLINLSPAPFTLALARLETHPKKPSTLATGDSPHPLLARTQILALPAGSVRWKNTTLRTTDFGRTAARNSDALTSLLTFL